MSNSDDDPGEVGPELSAEELSDVTDLRRAAERIAARLIDDEDALRAIGNNPDAEIVVEASLKSGKVRVLVSCPPHMPLTQLALLCPRGLLEKRQ